MLNVLSLPVEEHKVKTPCLAECVSQSISRYLRDLGEAAPTNLYEMVLQEIERPLLLEVMRHCQGHRGQAAQCLGINRNTLRKKLIEHGLDDLYWAGD